MVSSRLQLKPGRAAFTLLEIVIALAVLGTMAAGVYIGFNSINTFATSTRLYSEAQIAAQNQIDLILSRVPFDVTANNLNKIPVELMTTSELDQLAASGVIFPTSPPASAPATTSKYYPYYPYYRTGSGQPIQRQAFIYQDPTTGTVSVAGTLTNAVVDTGMTMNYINNTNLNTRRARVVVTYTFRSNDYTVPMDVLRTADQ